MTSDLRSSGDQMPATLAVCGTQTKEQESSANDSKTRQGKSQCDCTFHWIFASFPPDAFPIAGLQCTPRLSLPQPGPHQALTKTSLRSTSFHLLPVIWSVALMSVRCPLSHCLISPAIVATAPPRDGRSFPRPLHSPHTTMRRELPCG